jgi:uncharacterized protein
MLPALIEFIHRLRDAGIPVSMVESLDAVEALRHVDLGSRRQLRAALAATLVKRAEHAPVFQALFDIHFARRRASPAEGSAQPPSPGALTGADPSGDLLDALGDALRRNDADALRALAGLAVREFGGLDAERAGSPSYYLYRVLRRLDLSNLLQRALQEGRDLGELANPLEEALYRAEQQRRVEELRRLVADEIRRNLVEIKGRDAAAEVYRRRPIEDVDFLGATPGQLREMRVAVEPLARALAARIAQRRRARRRRGRLDARRTIRRSLSSGGVPLEPIFRLPRVTRPDLYLLCDVSGSVAEFARFTISFLHAMNEAFSRIRSFAFVDGVDEVTDLLDEGREVLDAPRLLALANVVRADGHSDYGAVLDRFWNVYGRAGFAAKTTLIITGDARNNYRPLGVDALRAMRERARRVYWLNPEPRGEWDTADSVMGEYAPYCHGVFEVRNLRHLAAFVAQVTDKGA